MNGEQIVEFEGPGNIAAILLEGVIVSCTITDCFEYRRLLMGLTNSGHPRDSETGDGHE